MGVDTADFVSTIRRSRTGPGLRTSICGPSFPSPLAVLSPQPSADVRACRDRLRCACAFPQDNARAAFSRHGDGHAVRHVTIGRARGRDRRPRSRSAVSLGRLLAGGRLRLLGARLLDVRPARHRAPAQLVRARMTGSARRAIEDEARRPALLLRARPRRHLHRPRAHGARAALRHATFRSSGSEARRTDRKSWASVASAASSDGTAP